MSMGHLMGLFDQDFLGIRHTRKMASLRYAEFSCVENGKICKSGMFVDLIGLMIQAGEIHFRLPLEIILSTPAPGIMMVSCWKTPRKKKG